MPSAEYMRDYMRERRAHGLDKSRRAPSRTNKSRASSRNIVRHIPQGAPDAAHNEYQYNRHELRDGSGLMWPERAMNSDTPYSDANAEIDAAERHRHVRT